MLKHIRPKQVFGGSVTLITSTYTYILIPPLTSPGWSPTECQQTRDTAAAARSTTSLRNSSLESYLQDPSELPNGQEFPGVSTVDPISPNQFPWRFPGPNLSHIRIGSEQTERIQTYQTTLWAQSFQTNRPWTYQIIFSKIFQMNILWSFQSYFENISKTCTTDISGNISKAFRKVRIITLYFWSPFSKMNTLIIF